MTDGNLERRSLGAAHDARLLLADADAESAELVYVALRNAGFVVVTVGDGATALARLRGEPFELVVLDAAMTGPDGASMCTAIRAHLRTPIIVLGQRGSEEDVLGALESGADDYLSKPVRPRTLLARVEAILRRSITRGPTTVVEGEAVLDIDRRRLRAGRAELHLTLLETELLRALMSSPGRVVPTDKLIAGAWSRPSPDERRALKQVIYRLRRKLDRELEFADRVETLRSAGYRWRRSVGNVGR